MWVRRVVAPLIVGLASCRGARLEGEPAPARPAATATAAPVVAPPSSIQPPEPLSSTAQATSASAVPAPAPPSAFPPARGPERVAALDAIRVKLVPLHARLGKPKPGEWLAEHAEHGQTFREYLAARPIVPDAKRKVLYVQPLGELTPAQRRIVVLTADFMAGFFGLEVRTKADLPLSLVPASARRVHPSWGDKQILTTYVLEQVLRPRLPEDATAIIAFTASDLWPGKGWNFVFGQASLTDRVGVWSMKRNGDPDAGPAEARLALLRTLKVAVHETGHMFSVEHCTAYACVMNGSNSLDESDAAPLDLCPEDLAKISWATGVDPAARFRKLIEFSREHLPDQVATFERALSTLER